MTKYSFLIFHSDYLGFIELLRNAGVVHIVEKAEGVPVDDESLRWVKLQQQIKETTSILKSRKVQESKAECPLDVQELIEDVKVLRLTLDTKKADLQTTKKEIKQLEPWGKFSWSTVEKLKEAGQSVHFFSCSVSRFDAQWEKDYNLFKITDNGASTSFVIITDCVEAPDIKAQLHLLPRKSLEEQIGFQDALQQEIDDMNIKLNDFAAFGIGQLDELARKTSEEIQFKTVVLQASDKAGAKLKLLEGWVPVEKEATLHSELKDSVVYMERRIPTLKDNVPVLLKNNSFAKLFEVVGSLYSLPNYHELDLTPLFAPFFMLFFGFCLGDAGYGLFLLVAVTIIKFIKKKSALRPIFTLVQWLSVSTIVMGFVSGTFFGIPLLNIEGLSLRKFMLNSNQLFNFALIIGLIQIIFGLCVKAYSLIRFKGLKYAISTLGWILLIVGMIATFGFDKLKILPDGLKPILIYSLLGISGFMILIFCDPDSNPLISSLKGVWDVYGMVGGVFGDTLSYIRLFALGTSGAILGYVVNTISLQILHVAYVGPVFFIIFLLLGHSLTIALSILGAFVHPMRLTFVEFYKNAGFEGGGKMYKPFRLETNK